MFKALIAAQTGLKLALACGLALDGDAIGALIVAALAPLSAALWLSFD